MITRDDLIREYEARRRGGLPGLLLVYAAIVGTLLATAALMV